MSEDGHEVEMIAAVIYRTMNGEKWPPRYGDASDKDCYLLCARNILAVMSGQKPDYEKSS